MDQKIQIIVIETVNLLDWHLILTLVKHTNDTIGRSSLTCLRPLDFTPLFNWNTKQVFVTVVAQYENEKFVCTKKERCAFFKHWVIDQ